MKIYELEIKMIERIMTPDEYVESYFPHWRVASEKHLGKYVDPRNGGSFYIEDYEFDLGSYDPNRKGKKIKEPQRFHCISLDEFLEGIKAIESLKDADDLPLDELKARLRGYKFLGRYGLKPDAGIEEAYNSAQGNPHWHIDMCLMNNLSAVWQNAGINILTPRGDAIDIIYHAFSEDEELRKINPNLGGPEELREIRAGLSDTEKVEKRYFMRNKDGGSISIWELNYSYPFTNLDLSKVSNVAQIQLAPGTVSYATRSLMAITDVIKRNGFFGHFGVEKGALPEKMIIGAFYDPSRHGKPAKL